MSVCSFYSDTNIIELWNSASVLSSLYRLRWTVSPPDNGHSEWTWNGASVYSYGIRHIHCVPGCLSPAASNVWGSDRGHEKRNQREGWSYTSWWVWAQMVCILKLAWKLTCHTCFRCVVNFAYKVTNQICLCDFDTEPSKELRSMLRHLVEMLAAPSVSGPGRDSTINLLIKQVPRKSLKNPDNSLTLWLTDQGMSYTCAYWAVDCIPLVFQGNNSIPKKTDLFFFKF